MTREQAREALKSYGVAEPTEEQITNYLNTVNGEVKKEKDRADRLKAEADKVTELQKQLDEINGKSMTDIEKAQKEAQTANERAASLEAELKRMKWNAELAKAGVEAENVEKFFNENGEVDFAVLGQIISGARAAGAANKEAEIAGKATNPGGGTQQSGGHDDKTEAEKMAEVIGKTLGGNSKESADILSQYIK